MGNRRTGERAASRFPPEREGAFASAFTGRDKERAKKAIYFAHPSPSRRRLISCSFEARQSTALSLASSTPAGRVLSVARFVTTLRRQTNGRFRHTPFRFKSDCSRSHGPTDPDGRCRGCSVAALVFPGGLLLLTALIAHGKFAAILHLFRARSLWPAAANPRR